jgi:hypothetical protein
MSLTVADLEEECIELRERTQNGKTIAQFTNDTSVTEVQHVFASL